MGSPTWWRFALCLCVKSLVFNDVTQRLCANCKYEVINVNNGVPIDSFLDRNMRSVENDQPYRETFHSIFSPTQQPFISGPLTCYLQHLVGPFHCLSKVGMNLLRIYTIQYHMAKISSGITTFYGINRCKLLIHKMHLKTPLRYMLAISMKPQGIKVCEFDSIYAYEYFNI